MKTKLLTILSLLVLCVTGAWADDPTLPSGATPTGALNVLTGDANVTAAYTGTSNGKKYLTYDLGTEIRTNVVKNGKANWAKATATDGGSSVSSITFADDVTDAEKYGFKTSSLNKWGLNSSRYCGIRVVNCVEAAVSTKSNSNKDNKTLQIQVYKKNGDAWNYVETIGADKYNKDKAYVLTTSALDASEEYVILLTSGSTSNSDAYEIRLAANATPSLTGAWSAASGTIFKDDAVPTPTFTVSASNSAALTGSEYSVAYSVKEGSNDGLITITGEGAGFTLNNDATGTATLVATLTSANESNYTTPTTNTYEYVYTVNAKVPTYTLNKDDHDISLRSTPVHRAADTNETATVTMEAGFLTGTSGTVTFVGDAVDGLSVSPAVFTITDGSVAETEFTITYNSASGTSGTATLRFSDGTNSKDLLIDYASVVAHTWATVSGATTWDWSKLTGSDVQLTDETTPKKTDEFLLGDMDGEVLTQNVGYTPATFNADAIKMIAQYAVRNKSYAQATQVKFKTSVPGTVKVNYSNTGGSRPYRHIEVNGVLSAEGSASTTAIDTEEIPVTAGEVTIKVYIPDASSPQAGNDDVVGYTMARINKVIFTPLDGTTDVDVVKVTSVNYATYVTTAAIDFTKTAEVQAYKVTSTTDAIEYEEVEAAPAGTPLLIKATSSSYVLKAADSTPADVTGNLLQASIGSTVGDGSTIYVLGNNGGTAVWGKLKNGKTLSAGKAYLVITGGGAKEFYDIIIGGDGETTAIDHVSTPRFNSDAAIYNLSGQKVTESYKGIVIVNGKKYMNK